MNAAKISQTVELANPDNAQFTAAPVRLKPGCAICAGENSTKRANAAATAIPARPTAAAGIGSTTRPAITVTKMAK